MHKKLQDLQQRCDGENPVNLLWYDTISTAVHAVIPKNPKRLGPDETMTKSVVHGE